MKQLCALIILLLLSACSIPSTARVTPLPAPVGGIATAQPTTTLPNGETQIAPTAPKTDSPPISIATGTPFILAGNAPYPLKFNDMYSGRSLRYGLQFSDYVKALNGKQVTMEGYMAPPLKSSLDFFVLTEVQMALCPFCSSNADWPENIALVYLSDTTTTSTASPIRVTGRLELGAKVDEATGFVSQLRIYADKLEILN